MKLPEKYRARFSDIPALAPFDLFILPPRIGSRQLMCIASREGTWDHVSVHARDGNKQRTPTWDEMAYVKSMFWDDEEEAIQYHPRRSEYVNLHPNVLHLWYHPDLKDILPEFNFSNDLTTETTK